MQRVFLTSNQWAFSNGPGGLAIQAPPPFSPASISGLLAWHDASDSSSVILTSGAVSQWSDKSGNSNHLTQSTGASRPTLTAAALNGIACPTWDGTNHFMNWPATINARTVVLVAKWDGTTGDYRHMINGPAFPWHGDTQGGGGLSYATPFINASKWENGVAVSYNSGKLGRFTSWKRFMVIHTSAEGFNTFAEQSGLPARRFWGKVAEVIMYAGDIGIDNRLALESYLTTKWGAL